MKKFLTASLTLFCYVTLSLTSYGVTVDEYYESGKIKYNNHDYSGAIADYDKAIELNPNDAILYYNRGLAYRNKAEILRVNALHQLKLKPDSSIEEINKVFEPFQITNEKAIEDFTKAIFLKSDLAEAYYQRAYVLTFTNENEESIKKDLDMSIKLKPDFAEAYYARGGHYGKDQEQESIKDYTKAIELKPNYPKAYLFRGIKYNNIGQTQAAIKDFTKALELQPNLAMAYFFRGYAYKKENDCIKAKKDFNKACELGLSLACEHNDCP